MFIKLQKEHDFNKLDSMLVLKDMFVTLTCTIKMCSIFFQAVGKPINAAIVSLARDIIFFVPLVIILPNFMGIKGAIHYLLCYKENIGIIKLK